jgi:hypothetical protein
MATAAIVLCGVRGGGREEGVRGREGKGGRKGRDGMGWDGRVLWDWLM